MWLCFSESNMAAGRGRLLRDRILICSRTLILPPRHCHSSVVSSSYGMIIVWRGLRQATTVLPLYPTTRLVFGSLRSQSSTPTRRSLNPDTHVCLCSESIESLRVYHSGFYSHSHSDPWKFPLNFTLLNLNSYRRFGSLRNPTPLNFTVDFN